MVQFLKLVRKYYYFVILIILITPFVSHAETINQSRIFTVDSSYDAYKRSQINATVHDISNHAYFFVEDMYWNSLSYSGQSYLSGKILDLKKEYENKIYSTETTYFGSEPNPGIDNDPHVYIVLTTLKESTGGYYDTSNEYTKEQISSSNEAEVIYLNVSVLNDPARIYAFLAHEFQHLISFNQKEKAYNIPEDIWLNEARSEFAITLVGYNNFFQDSNMERRLQSYLNAPSDSLTEWKNELADYGQVSLFGEYVAEHWPVSFWADVEKSSKAGIASIEDALAKNQSTEKFRDVFRNWLAANYINRADASFKFGYTRSGLTTFHVVPNKSIVGLSDTTSVPITDYFKDWQGHWYEISNFEAGHLPILRIKLTSSSLTSFDISYLVYHADGKVDLRSFEPRFGNDSLYVEGLGSDVQKVVLMPFKHDKISGFTSNESTTDLAMLIDRVGQMIVLPSPSPIPLHITTPTVKPGDFGLHEGDFIRAEGDPDVYVINEYGYKRLILNPEICFLYGHLQSRGCFAAVKVVTPSVRDAFKTSWYITNGETNDGAVYVLTQVSDDVAYLSHLDFSGSEFISQGGDFNSIFKINSKEKNLYGAGPNIFSLPNTKIF